MHFLSNTDCNNDPFIFPYCESHKEDYLKAISGVRAEVDSSDEKEDSSIEQLMQFEQPDTEEREINAMSAAPEVTVNLDDNPTAMDVSISSQFSHEDRNEGKAEPPTNFQLSGSEVSKYYFLLSK